MRKVRVFQLARELRTSVEEVIKELAALGCTADKASAVDAELAEQVQARLAGAKRKSVRDAAAMSEPAADAAARPMRAVERAAPAAAKRRAAPQPQPLPVWDLPPLPKTPEVVAPVLGSSAPAAAPPPARRVGPAVPGRGDMRVAPPVERERRTPAAARGPAARPELTRTYRPEAPGELPGREGRPGRRDRGRGERDTGREVGRDAEVGERPGDRRGKRAKRKKKRAEVSEQEVFNSVRRTMATLDVGRSRKKRRIRTDDGAEVEVEDTRVRINEFATVSELAAVLEVRPNEVVAACLKLGVLANVNRRLDRDTIEAVADEFGYEVEFVKEFGEEIIEEVEETHEDVPEEARPAIVTVMGHVDHGKTKLLDFIRKSDVVSGESGGITQHIGAYQARLADKRAVTFLDTPGHQAFTAMRARGADVTDIVVLVVAADDRVNEQTIEAINHAKAARKPIVVAINKVDLPNANPDRIRQQLAEQGLQVEEWGGQTIAVEISAKFGQNVDKLLEMVLLVAEMLDLKAQKDRPAKGTIIEAKKDAGRGIVATVLIQNGTLAVGDAFVCGTAWGKVRAMGTETGDRIESASPSTPVEVLGWSDVPQVGDAFSVVGSEAQARLISAERGQIAREKRMRLAAGRFRLGELHARLKEQTRIDLRVIIKADVQGSVEVLRDSMEKLTDEQVQVVVIHTGVGRINESDVLLATASGAIIVGFHVRPDPKATQLAQEEGVEVRLYSVIYEAIEEIEAAKAGLLKPKEQERVLGSAEVRNVFEITKVGTVAGCHVVAGTIARTARARVIRENDVVWSGRILSLKRFKEDAREVAQGYECGLSLEGFNDIKVGDLIEAYVVEEVSPVKKA